MDWDRIYDKVLSKFNVCYFVFYRVGLLEEKEQNIYRIEKERKGRDSE